MRDDEWDRLPAPWRLFHAVTTGVIWGAILAAAALALHRAG